MITAHEQSKPHIIGYGKLIAVWLALMVMLGLSVWVSRLDLGISRIWASLFIASAKAGLVIAFFMHMRYEANIIRWLLFAALVILAISIGFTFLDVLYR